VNLEGLFKNLEKASQVKKEINIHRDISRSGAKRRRRHSETCVAVSETSGWSPVARTKPSGWSFDRRLIGFCKKKPHSIKDITMEQTLMKLKILLPFEIF